MSLIIYEINDPFAMDFGLDVKLLSYTSGKNLKSYIPDEEAEFYNKKGEVLLGSHIPEDGEVIYLSYHIGWPLVQMIVAIIISIVLNIIFAPDVLDLSDNRPEYATYLWGKGATKSEAMLNIPILLGTFPLFGNLISASSKTEVKTQSMHTLYDNIHLLYGLCSNPLESVQSVSLSKIDAANYKATEDEELAVYYTKGDINQLPIRAFPDVKEHYPDVDPTIYRYAELDNQPLLPNEVLLPDFTTEFYPNFLLEKASHVIHNATLKYEKLEELNGDIICLGKCLEDGSGTLEDILPETTTPFFIKIKSNEVSHVIKDVDCSSIDQSSADYTDYCIVYDGGDVSFLTEIVHVPVEVVTEDVPFPSGAHILAFDSKNIRSPGVYGKGTTKTEPDQYWEDTFYVEKVSDNVLKVLKRNNCIYPIEKGSHAQKAKVVEGQISLGPSKWFMSETEPGPAITYPTSSTFGVEDIFFYFVALNGFFYSDVRRSNPVRYGIAWVSFEYTVIQKLNGVIVAASLLAPTNTSGYNRPPSVIDENEGSPKYFIGCYKESVMIKQSITELLRFTPSAGNPDDTPLTQVASYPLIQLTSEGYLQARDELGTPYVYEVKVRQYSHGVKLNEGYFDVYYQPDEAHKHMHPDETPEQLSIDLKLHRVTEVNYDETLNYAGIPLLGISINATASLNNSLPDLQVIGTSSFRLPNGTLDISSWSTGRSNNPAVICLNILYDTFYGAGLGGSCTNASKGANFNKLVDLPKFLEFFDYCNDPVQIDGLSYVLSKNPDEFILEEGEYVPKRHTCNGVIDDDLTLWACLVKILKTADAQPVLIGKRISVTWERDFTEYGNTEEDPVLTPSMIFTSSNIVKDSLAETFQSTSDFINAVEGEFYDADNDFEQTSINLNLQAYDTTDDTNKSMHVDLFGITNRYRAYRKLRKAIRSSNLVRHNFEFTTSLVGYNIVLGDVIGLQYELVDWSVVQDDPETYSGRIVSSTIDTFTLDKLFPFSQGETYKILVFNQGSNSYQIYNVESHSFDTGVPVIGVSSELHVPTSFPKDALYVIGKTNLLYKDLIVLETTIKDQDLVSVKACEYSSDLFRLDGYLHLITDFANYNFTEENCAPQQFEVKAETSYTNLEGNMVGTSLPVYGSWVEPKVVTDGVLKVHKYQIYRRLGNMNNVSAGITKKWVRIAEVAGDTTTFTDDGMNNITTYEYKVKPIFIFKFRHVTIPNKWCPVADIYMDYMRDFLQFPEVVKSTVYESTSNPGYYDFMCEVSGKKAWLYDPSHEFYGLWVARKKDSSTTWLDPLSITLTADCTVNDSSITVSSIKDLPTDGNGNVTCILALDFEDIVFVKGNSDKTLYIANMDSTYPTALKINKAHKAGTVVRSRHHGFFPIRVFATTPDNGLARGVSSNNTTSDTIYVYSVEDNSVKIFTPNTTYLKEGVSLWNREIMKENAWKYWRAQTCGDRVVVDLQGVQLLTDETTGIEFFNFTHASIPTRYNDLLFAAGGLANDYTQVQIYPFFRGENIYKMPPATKTAEGNYILKVERVAEIGESFWVGAQHLILSEEFDYGYTSFIKEI